MSVNTDQVNTSPVLESSSRSDASVELSVSESDHESAKSSPIFRQVRDDPNSDRNDAPGDIRDDDSFFYYLSISDSDTDSPHRTRAATQAPTIPGAPVHQSASPGSEQLHGDEVQPYVFADNEPMFVDNSNFSALAIGSSYPVVLQTPNGPITATLLITGIPSASSSLQNGASV